MKKLLPLFLQIAAGTTLLFSMVPTSARASILWAESSGILEANNFWYNRVERSTSIKGFDEEQQVTLDTAIPHQSLNEWDDLTNLLYLDPGMVVDSHMLYFANPNPRDGRITAEATVKFSGTIVGLIGDSSFFYPYNYLFAPNATNNPASGGWTLEEELSWTPLDEVQFVSEDTLQLNWTTRSAIDPLRVLTLSATQAVPEPLTLLGAGTAIVMGGFFKSKLKNNSKNVIEGDRS
ncbi:MAG: PEP-CTERM sorting domain-containing protein [Crocosphaera sp.]|nr:PEP-CTERM sorting domain-containing protein [Crocosphaera sp.]